MLWFSFALDCSFSFSNCSSYLMYWLIGWLAYRVLHSHRREGIWIYNYGIETIQLRRVLDRPLVQLHLPSGAATCVSVVLGSTAGSKLLMTAAIYVAGTSLIPVITMCTRLRSMVATLVQCICNAWWHSISHNERYALGGNVVIVATGLWQVACVEARWDGTVKRVNWGVARQCICSLERIHGAVHGRGVTQLCVYNKHQEMNSCECQCSSWQQMRPARVHPE